SFHLIPFSSPLSGTRLALPDETRLSRISGSLSLTSKRGGGVVGGFRLVRSSVPESGEEGKGLLRIGVVCGGESCGVASACAGVPRATFSSGRRRLSLTLIRVSHTRTNVAWFCKMWRWSMFEGIPTVEERVEDLMEHSDEAALYVCPNAWAL